MSTEKFFITGAMGCLGAWVVRNLVQQGISTTVFDLSANKHRLELIMKADELAQVHFIQGDLTHTATVLEAIESVRPTHIIHLAALQVPFCKANPPLGAAVNVVGTVNIFEAAKKMGLKHLVYASSVAVYGHKDDYSTPVLAHDALPRPHTLYGVYKHANEETARIYWQDYEIASAGLRPYTIYGPGRDQGLTSTPTQAMLAAARGNGFHIPFGGKNGFQYVDDVARIFIQAARTAPSGAEVLNIKGDTVHVRDVIAAIEAVEPAIAGRITFDDEPLAFPDGQDDTALRQRFGALPHTPLSEGVAQTIAHFKAAIADNRLPQENKL